MAACSALARTSRSCGEWPESAHTVRGPDRARLGSRPQWPACHWRSRAPAPRQSGRLKAAPQLSAPTRYSLGKASTDRPAHLAAAIQRGQRHAPYRRSAVTPSKADKGASRPPISSSSFESAAQCRASSAARPRCARWICAVSAARCSSAT
jgi:hypothetical protein